MPTPDAFLPDDVRYVVYLWSRTDGGCWVRVQAHDDERDAQRHVQQIGGRGWAATYEREAKL